MNYYEIIEAIADNPIILYTLMGLLMLIFLIFCYTIKGPTYGYL